MMPIRQAGKTEMTHYGVVDWIGVDGRGDDTAQNSAVNQGGVPNPNQIGID